MHSRDWAITVGTLVLLTASGASALGGSVYKPVRPCRIFDSRPVNGGTGIFADGETRSIDAVGATKNFSGQGGSAIGCGVPGFAGAGLPQVTAIAANITAASPTGAGNLRVFPGSDPTAPNASVVNYQLLNPNLNVNGGTIIPVRQDVEGADIKVFASRSTHVVIDVVGYFTNAASEVPGAATALGNSCFDGTTYPCNTPGFAWIGGSPVSVALGAMQAAVVSGSTVAVQKTAANNLGIIVGICAAPPGTLSGMTVIDGPVDTFLPPGSIIRSIPISLTRVVTAARLGGAGTYSVGLCYLDAAAPGTVTDEATVTTVVINTQ